MGGAPHHGLFCQLRGRNGNSAPAEMAGDTQKTSYQEELIIPGENAGDTVAMLLQLCLSRYLNAVQVNYLMSTEALELSSSPPLSLRIGDGSGVMVMYSRKQCKRFRDDGIAWSMRANGKTLNESHERFRVPGVEGTLLNVYYATSADGTVMRRIFWRTFLPDGATAGGDGRASVRPTCVAGAVRDDLVLVHYLSRSDALASVAEHTSRTRNGRGEVQTSPYLTTANRGADKAAPTPANTAATAAITTPSASTTTTTPSIAAPAPPSPSTSSRRKGAPAPAPAAGPAGLLCKLRKRRASSEIGVPAADGSCVQPGSPSARTSNAASPRSNPGEVPGSPSRRALRYLRLPETTGPVVRLREGSVEQQEQHPLVQQLQAAQGGVADAASGGGGTGQLTHMHTLRMQVAEQLQSSLASGEQPTSLRSGLQTGGAAAAKPRFPFQTSIMGPPVQALPMGMAMQEGVGANAQALYLCDAHTSHNTHELASAPSSVLRGSEGFTFTSLPDRLVPRDVLSLDYVPMLTTRGSSPVMAHGPAPLLVASLVLEGCGSVGAGAAGAGSSGAGAGAGGGGSQPMETNQPAANRYQPTDMQGLGFSGSARLEDAHGMKGEADSEIRPLASWVTASDHAFFAELDALMGLNISHTPAPSSIFHGAWGSSSLMPCGPAAAAAAAAAAAVPFMAGSVPGLGLHQETGRPAGLLAPAGERGLGLEGRGLKRSSDSLILIGAPAGGGAALFGGMGGMAAHGTLQQQLQQQQQQQQQQHMMMSSSLLSCRPYTNYGLGGLLGASGPSLIHPLAATNLTNQWPASHQVQSYPMSSSSTYLSNTGLQPSRLLSSRHTNNALAWSARDALNTAYSPAAVPGAARVEDSCMMDVHPDLFAGSACGAAAGIGAHTSSAEGAAAAGAFDDFLLDSPVQPAPPLVQQQQYNAQQQQYNAPQHQNHSQQQQPQCMMHVGGHRPRPRGAVAVASSLSSIRANQRL